MGENRGDRKDLLNNYNYDMYDYLDLEEGDWDGGGYFAAYNVAQASGTEGFVLKGALNSILPAVQSYMEGKGSAYSIITPLCQDLHLSPLWEDEPQGYNYPGYWAQTLMDALESIVEEIQAQHYQEEGFWDFRTDQPRLSWHQLYLYFAAYMEWEEAGGTGPKPTIMDRDEADSIKIPACRLHKECNEESYPDDWGLDIEVPEIKQVQKIELLMDKLLPSDKQNPQTPAVPKQPVPEQPGQKEEGGIQPPSSFLFGD